MRRNTDDELLRPTFLLGFQMRRSVEQTADRTSVLATGCEDIRHQRRRQSGTTSVSGRVTDVLRSPAPSMLGR